MSGAQSAVERLAEQWNQTRDWAPTPYDQGRVDQRHDMTSQLLEAIEADRVRGGVVAEEPEWEYGIRDTAGDEMIAGPQSTTEGLVPLFAGEVLERRRKAGPWVPVKQEGAEK